MYLFTDAKQIMEAAAGLKEEAAAAGEDFDYIGWLDRVNYVKRSIDHVTRHYNPSEMNILKMEQAREIMRIGELIYINNTR
ncbi:hypothetical protein [Phage f2b1]|nr:hypothetical protein [Phage f2b1]